MSHIELYAELLTNIRTCTLVASLHTETNAQTKVDLLSDDQTITVTHEGLKASLRLPTQMIGGGTAKVTLPERPSKDITLRLKVQETAPGLLDFENSDENFVPWSAGGMQEVEGIACVRCAALLVQATKVSEWRDLPNENWAEMMEFWHCHKPHEHEHGKSSADEHVHRNGHGGDTADPIESGTGIEGKGYAAGNRFRVKQGNAFVGTTHFLFAAEDCLNIESKEGNEDIQTLKCKSCYHDLGVSDSNTQAWKLNKWSLSLTLSQPSTSDSPKIRDLSISKWISILLLHTVDNSGVRRFVVESREKPEDSQTGLLLWLFTESLSFSSSHRFWERRDPTRAMKVLWQATEKTREILDERHFSHEQLVLPEHVYDELEKVLRDSGELLPRDARKMKEWNVGLIERVCWEDVRGADAKVHPPGKELNRQDLPEQVPDKAKVRLKSDRTIEIKGMEGSASLFE